MGKGCTVRGRALGELAALLVTVGLFLVFENVLHWKLQFLIPAALGWIGYVVRRLRAEPGLASEWGFRADSIGRAAPSLLGCFALGLAVLLTWRLVVGGPSLPSGAWVVFVAYPVWSLIQQFVLQVLVASNLQRLGIPRLAVVPICGALFGLAHLPDWPLAALCSVAGAAWTSIYLRRPHLPLLALCHAWLGTLAFYWVLQRDPWAEMLPR